MIRQVFAAGICNPLLPGKIGCGGKDAGGVAVGSIVSGLISLILILAFLLSLFFLITGAITWITSSGDKNNLEAARDRITHSIIGLIIVASVWAIMTLVGNFLGIDITKIPIPTIQ